MPAYQLGERHPALEPETTPQASAALPDRRPPPVAVLVLLQTIVSAASLVVEIVAGRMLAPYVGMSLYTWTSIIAVVLAGFSAGHWAGGRLAERRMSTSLIVTGLGLAAAAFSTAAAVFLLRWSAGPVITALTAPIASITALSMIVFFLPSFFAGIPAPVLAHISVDVDRTKAGRALGAMFAAGALGAIAGTLLAGFVFISYLGSTGTLAAVTVTYAVCALILLAYGGFRNALAVPVAVAVLAAMGLAAASLAKEDPCTRESDNYCIRVLDVSNEAADPDYPDDQVNLMVLDHLAHGVSSRDRPDVMFTLHAAMLEEIASTRMAGRPFSAFLIGGGTYSIPRSWGAKPGIDVTVAEIDPAVTEMAEKNFWFDPSIARIFHEDARRALAERPDKYDVVIGDAFTDITIPQHLVTKEFFELIRSRLTEDGVYLMNLIDHVDRLDALSSVAATLQAVFPEVEIWTKSTGQPLEGRVVFILAAGNSRTAVGRLHGLSPEPYTAGRLTQDTVKRLIASDRAVILTDDYAPIDRLMALRE